MTSLLASARPDAVRPAQRAGPFRGTGTGKPAFSAILAAGWASGIIH